MSNDSLDIDDADRQTILDAVKATMRRSDAVQNVTEALFACGLVDAGVWVVMHGRALRFPASSRTATG